MIDVQAAFSEFVQTLGGRLVADLVGKSPAFANADYLFEREKVVMELKRLEDDKSENLEIQEKIQGRFEDWIGRGIIPPIYERVRVDSRTLPVECQRELVDLYKPAIQRRVLKANKQIKSTIQQLRLADYKGALLLVNDGNYALDSYAVLYLLARILGRKFGNINSVLYCTVNMLADSPLTSKPAVVWAHATRESVVEPLSVEWCLAFFRSWSGFLGERYRMPIEEISASSMEDLENIRFVATRSGSARSGSKRGR